MVSAEQRFFVKVQESETGCWLWVGGRSTAQYGMFWNGSSLVLAHRWAFEFLRDLVPEGLELDHLCHTPPCVNPWHLDPVTHQVNMQRMLTRKPKEICKRGHPRPERGTCLPCKIIRQRERRADVKLSAQFP